MAARGVIQAKIYIDGHEAGYSPLVFHRVRAGRRRIKIVEDKQGKPGKSKVVDVVVTPKNTRKSPLILVVKL